MPRNTSGSTGTTSSSSPANSGTGGDSTNQPQFQGLFTPSDFPPLNAHGPQTAPDTTNWHDHFDGRSYAEVVIAEPPAAVDAQLTGLGHSWL